MNGIPFEDDIEGRGSYYHMAHSMYLLYDYQFYYRKFIRLEDDAKIPTPPENAELIDEPHGLVRVYVRKNKDGDWGDYIYLKRNKAFMTFEDVDDSVVEMAALHGAGIYGGQVE